MLIHFVYGLHPRMQKPCSARFRVSGSRVSANGGLYKWSSINNLFCCADEMRLTSHAWPVDMDVRDTRAISTYLCKTDIDDRLVCMMVQ